MAETTTKYMVWSRTVPEAALMWGGRRKRGKPAVRTVLRRRGIHKTVHSRDRSNRPAGIPAMRLTDMEAIPMNGETAREDRRMGKVLMGRRETPMRGRTQAMDSSRNMVRRDSMAE